MVSEDAWALAPPIAKLAAAGWALQLVDVSARTSPAEGAFDRAEAHLSRTSLKLDDRGWDQLNKACLKFVEQVEKIEAGAKERQQKRPHEEELGDAALVLLAFEAERLSGKEPEAKTKRGSRRPPRASARS
jgi:hypothetical protein